MIYATKPSNFSPRFEVVSCFVEWNGQILLLHRPSHKSQGEKWGVPAGKRESGEEVLEALLREINEETGLSLKPDTINYYDKLYVSHGHDFVYYIFHTLLIEPPEITLNPAEHQGFCWQTPQESLSLPLVDDLDSCIKLFYEI